MKKLLLLIMLITYSTAMFSQLFVKPNGGTDSYVYVKDEILFVEQDVNLQDNGPGVTQASLYLREGAQLIQGSSGSANKGDGQLSVYQNAPDSDQYTYNFWCPPVGNETIAGNGNKNFGLYRLYDIQDETDSDVAVGTPTYYGTSSPLTISTRWMYTHLKGTETEGDYERINAGDLVLPGYGFIMRGVDATPVAGTGFEYDFRGRPHNGDLDIQVYYNTTLLRGELTLSGNPYPSALDLNRVYYDSDNSEIYQFRYWDEDKDRNSIYYSNNAGGFGTWVPGVVNDPNGTLPGIYTIPAYSTWDAAGNTYPPGSHTAPLIYQRRFAPIGQGFMIVPDATASAPGGSTVTIKNSHRRYIKEGAANNSEFRTPENGSSDDDITSIDPTDPTDPIPSNEMSLLRINTSFIGSHIRQMVLAFSDQSTPKFDRGGDATHPMDAAGAEIYFPLEIEDVPVQLVIQTIPFEISKRVAVTIKVSRLTKVAISVIEELNFIETAYLFDALENNYQQISGGELAGILLEEAGTYTDRFYIVFQSENEAHERSEGTILKEKTIANVDFFQNNPLKQLEIRNPEGYDIKTAMVYDMAGKLVINKSNLGSNNNITLSTSNISDGIYLVQLITSENINIDYKMIIKNN